MNRSDLLLQLRPDLNSIATKLDSSPVEQFQNTVLRQILASQNSLTLAVIKSQPHFGAISKNLDKEDFDSALQKLCTESRIRNQLIGIVLGLMTVEEYKHYTKDAKEYNKRIINMQIERYRDQLQV